MIESSTCRLTEKIFKPIIIGVPFLVLGPYKILNYLRSKGFDLLDDIFNHSYDEIKNPFQRINAIILEMERIDKITIKNNRIEKMYKNNILQLKKWHKLHYSSFSKEIISFIS